MRKFVGALLASTLALSSAATAATGDTARIVDEGMNRSQLMLNAHELFDDIGPRLTISTNMRKAQDWAVRKFTGYGLSNVHKEGFVFGRGWDIVGSSVRLVSPRPIQLVAIPVAWTPPTNGPLSAPVIVAPMDRPEHFAAYHGKLAGKIVMVTLPGEGSEPTDPPFHRLTSEEISKEDSYQVPHFDPEEKNGFLKRIDFYRQLDKFLASEGALAVIKKARTDGKLVSAKAISTRSAIRPSFLRSRSRRRIIAASPGWPSSARIRSSRSTATCATSTMTATRTT